MSSSTGMRERALGALYGQAVGDALGMPTQSMSRAQITKRYGTCLTELYAGPPDQPIAPNLAAGTVTDDTEQTLLLADLLIAGRGSVDPLEYAASLGEWEADLVRRGSQDLLGPSTRRAIEAVRSGVPASEAGRHGATNGAAMRAPALAVATPADDLTALVDRVEEVCRVTHNTTLGIASAAAVTAAVSAGIGGADPADALAVGVRAAELAGNRGYWVAGGLIAPRLRWSMNLAHTLDPDELLDAVHELVGTSVAAQESVPAAFALAVGAEASPGTALGRAAAIGGDTDTIASILGALVGSVVGLSGLPMDLVGTVRAVNDLGIEARVDSLLEIRNSP